MGIAILAWASPAPSPVSLKCHTDDDSGRWWLQSDASRFWSCSQCWGVSVSWRRSWWSQTAASHLSGRSCPASPPSCLMHRASSRKQPPLSRRRSTRTEPTASNCRGMRWFPMTPPPLQGSFWGPLLSLLSPPACQNGCTGKQSLLKSHPCCEGVCWHWLHPLSAVCLISPHSVSNSVEILLCHTKEHGLKRVHSRLCKKSCEREVWLLFVRHVRALYYLWYLSAKTQNHLWEPETVTFRGGGDIPHENIQRLRTETNFIFPWNLPASNTQKYQNQKKTKRLTRIVLLHRRDVVAHIHILHIYIRRIYHISIWIQTDVLHRPCCLIKNRSATLMHFKWLKFGGKIINFNGNDQSLKSGSSTWVNKFSTLTKDSGAEGAIIIDKLYCTIYYLHQGGDVFSPVGLCVCQPDYRIITVSM